MKIRKMVGKLGVVAAATVAAMAVWGGGVARADGPYAEIQPDSGQPGILNPFASPMCVALDGNDGFYNDYTRVVQWSCNGHPDQQWTWVYVETDPISANPMYYIKNQQSGKCITVRTADTFNGTRVVQYSCIGLTTQLWEPAPGHTAKPWSALRVGVNMCLDVRGGGTDNETPLEQWTCNGGDNQSFF